MIDSVHMLVRNIATSITQNIQLLSIFVAQILGDSKKKKSILALDGARGIACFAVLSYHFSLLARNYGLWNPVHGPGTLLGTLVYFGESGVILFFLLSAFLLFLPFAKAMLFDGDWPALRRFYLRRIFRIIPGYYAALFLLIIFAHPEFMHHSRWHTVLKYLTFRMEPGTSNEINGPFWTLAIEFQFYLLLPFISWVLCLLVRGGSLRWRMTKMTLLLSLLLLWGLLTRFWGQFIASTNRLDFLIPHTFSNAMKPWIYGLGGKYYEVFALGMFLGMVYTYVQTAPGGEIWKTRLRKLSPSFLLVGTGFFLFLSLYHFYYISRDMNEVFAVLDPYKRHIYSIWLYTESFCYGICYLLFMAAALFGSTRIRRPFEWTPLRWLGLISFSLYMWHLPFLFLFVNVFRQNLLEQHFGQGVQYLVYTIWVLVVILPISVMLYRAIEMPGIRLGEKFVRKFGRQPTKLAVQKPDTFLPDIPVVADPMEYPDSERIRSS